MDKDRWGMSPSVVKCQAVTSACASASSGIPIVYFYHVQYPLLSFICFGNEKVFICHAKTVKDIESGGGLYSGMVRVTTWLTNQQLKLVLSDSENKVKKEREAGCPIALQIGKNVKNHTTNTFI